MVGQTSAMPVSGAPLSGRATTSFREWARATDCGITANTDIRGDELDRVGTGAALQVDGQHGHLVERRELIEAEVADACDEGALRGDDDGHLPVEGDRVVLVRRRSRRGRRAMWAVPSVRAVSAASCVIGRRSRRPRGRRSRHVRSHLPGVTPGTKATVSGSGMGSGYPAVTAPAAPCIPQSLRSSA